MTNELLLAISGMFVLSAVLAAWATSGWLAAHSAEQLRFRTWFFGGHEPAPPAPLAEQPDPVLAQLSKFIPKSPADMNRLQRRLTRAGLPHRSAAVYFSLAEIALTAAFGITTYVFIGGAGQGVLLALAAAALGYVLPQLWLLHKTTVRQRAIANALPDALDLMTLCVEAGNSLDQAISKTAAELEFSYPILARELMLVVTESRAGKPRLEAFKNFAERIDLEDIYTLVGMLTQTDRFGTSVGQALRTQADTERVKRRQFAEERAGKVSVKLVFPLALCLLPAMFVVVFGPVAIRIYHELLESTR